jgi:hypothetical protein
MVFMAILACFVKRKVNIRISTLVFNGYSGLFCETKSKYQNFYTFALLALVCWYHSLLFSLSLGHANTTITTTQLNLLATPDNQTKKKIMEGGMEDFQLKGLVLFEQPFGLEGVHLARQA